MTFDEALEKMVEMMENDRPRQEAHGLLCTVYAAERRERIATAALSFMLSATSPDTYEQMAEEAVRHADALIAELDKPKGTR